MLRIEAFHDFIKISTMSIMHEHNFKDMYVSKCEINISACSLYAISLEDMDFDGCMFIEMGMNQRCMALLAFFSACTHTAYFFSSSCI